MLGRISTCLQQRLLSQTLSWRLKLANFKATALPQLHTIMQILCHLLHKDAKLPLQQPVVTRSRGGPATGRCGDTHR